MGGKRIAEDKAAGDRRGLQGPAGHDHQAREEGGDRAAPAPLRPHLAPAPRQHAARLLRAPHARRPPSGSTRSTRRSPTREPTRASSPATWPARSSRSPSSSGHNPQYTKGAEYVTGARHAAARPRGERREGRGPPRDHPHQLRARPVEDGRRRAEDLRPGGQALPGDLPPRRRVRAHPRRDHGHRARVPHQRPGADHRRLARRCTARRSRRRASRTTTPAATRACRSSSRARTWRRARSSRCARRPSRRGASPRRRCSARWRPPARTSRTPSCARR